MDNIKLSLVSNTGLLLASKPESADDTQQILASGLISAILTYAREIQHEDLQSLTYHDRTVVFMQFQDFVFVVETIGEAFELSERQSRQLLEQVRLSAGSLLIERSPESLTHGEAALILEHCFHDINSLNLILTKHPLRTLQPEYILIYHSEEGMKIHNSEIEREYKISISRIIDKYIKKIELDHTFHSFVALIPEHKKTFYIVFKTDGNATEVGYFSFPQELDYTIFRIYPRLEDLINEISKNNFHINLNELFNILLNYEDEGNRFSRTDLSEISLSSLFNVLEENLDMVLFNLFSGNPMYIVGDKPVVKILIDTLSIFTQHLSYDVVDWLRIENIHTIPKSYLREGIIGMSKEIYEKLKNSTDIDSNIIIINLEDETVIGDEELFFRLDFLDEIKNEDPTRISVLIFQELKKLVSFSYILTSLISLDDDPNVFVDNITSQFPDSPNLIEVVKKLALKRNKLLGFTF